MIIRDYEKGCRIKLYIRMIYYLNYVNDQMTEIVVTSEYYSSILNIITT